MTWKLFENFSLTFLPDPYFYSYSGDPNIKLYLKMDYILWQGVGSSVIFVTKVKFLWYNFVYLEQQVFVLYYIVCISFQIKLMEE